MRGFAGWVLVLHGCAVAVPPPSHLTGTGGISARTTAAVDAAAAAAIDPAFGLSASGPIGSAVTVEVGGQVTDSAFAANPGLWMRGPLHGAERLWGGIRVGPVLGTGEGGDAVSFDNPYAGASAQVQGAWRFGASRVNPGIVSATLGFEWTEPLYGDRHPRVRRVEGHPLYLVAGQWLSGEVGLEVPVGHVGALRTTVGADAYLRLPPFPRWSFGARLALGAGKAP